MGTPSVLYVGYLCRTQTGDDDGTRLDVRLTSATVKLDGGYTPGSIAASIGVHAESHTNIAVPAGWHSQSPAFEATTNRIRPDSAGSAVGVLDP
jgi:hypothetical protein